MKQKKKELLFEQVVKEQYSHMYRLCMGYLINKNEIEDLLQEIFINVWNNLDKFRGDAKLSTWVYRIAVNTALLFNKNTIKNHAQFAELKTTPLPYTTLHEKRQEEKRLIHLKECIQTLEKTDRLVISLLLEGLAYEEIAEVTGISSNYVGVKIHRIKEYIFKQLKNLSHE